MPRLGFGSGVALGAVVVGLVWLGAAGRLDRSGSIDVGYGQIRSIQLQPVPEGVTGPLFVPRPHRADELPLELVRNFVRTPLPAPLHQPGGCGSSGDLVIVLKGSGRRIAYGPCRWPWQISELWGAMVEAEEAVACGSTHVPRGRVCAGLAAARRRPLQTAS